MARGLTLGGAAAWCLVALCGVGARALRRRRVVKAFYGAGLDVPLLYIKDFPKATTTLNLDFSSLLGPSSTCGSCSCSSPVSPSPQRRPAQTQPLLPTLAPCTQGRGRPALKLSAAVPAPGVLGTKR